MKTQEMCRRHRRVGVIYGRLIALFLVTAALGAQAATWCNWLGGEGAFGDNSMWDKPNYSRTGNHIGFNNGGTVDVDGHYTNSNFRIWSSSVEFTGNGETVTTGPIDFTNAVIALSGSVTVDTSRYNRVPTACLNVSMTVSENATARMMNTAAGITNLVVRDSGTFSSPYTLTIPAGGTLVQSGGTISVATLAGSGDIRLSGGTLVAGVVNLSGASLVLNDARLTIPVSRSMTVPSVSACSATGSGGIDFSLPDGLAAGRYVVMSGEPGSDFYDIPMSLVGASEGWTLHKVANYIVVASETDPSSLSVSNPYTWVGGHGALWSEGANWLTRGSAPTNDASVFVLGYCGPVVSNNVANARYAQIRNVAENTDGIGTATPVVVRGEAIELTSTATRSKNAAVVTESIYPLIFECRVFSNANTLNPYAVGKNGSPANYFAGGVSAKRMETQGRVWFGGVSTIGRFCYSGEINSASRGHLYVMRGGDLSITNQSEAIERGCTVKEGGSMTIGGTKFAWNSTTSINPKDTHIIDGRLTVTAPYISFPKDQEYSGCGTVRLPAISAEQTSGPYALRLSGSLSVYLAGFTTAHGGAVYRNIHVDSGSVTLGAERDWTYGPDEATASSRTSLATNRAVRIESGATLTVDTSDPSDGTGYVVTFSDPVVGGGTLRKAGAGTLLLGASGEECETSLSHEGGVLRLACVQSFADVSFAPGARIEFSGVLADALDGGAWTTIAYANSATGLGNVSAEGFVFRVVEDGGGVAIQAKTKPGIILIVF